jgi:hypothetical protein
MRRRFQFSLKMLLVAMLVAAAFFGGMTIQRQIAESKQHSGVRVYPLLGPCEKIVLPDGTVRLRPVRPPIEPDDK